MTTGFDLEDQVRVLQQHVRALEDTLALWRLNGLSVVDFENAGLPGVTDHGALTGLTDDDHTQYLKEEASGGAASEVPDHSHASAAEAGTVAHSVLTGVTADQHHAEAHGASVHTNRTRTLYVSLGAFTASTGTPAFGDTTGNTAAAWSMALNDGIHGGFTVPSDYASGGDLTIFYRMASATTGAVSLRGNLDAPAEGATIEAGGTNITLVDTVQGTATFLNVAPITSFGAVLTAGHWCRVRLDRTGASDTATGNMEVVAIMFTYTADS